MTNNLPLPTLFRHAGEVAGRAAVEALNAKHRPLTVTVPADMNTYYQNGFRNGVIAAAQERGLTVEIVG